MIHFVRFSLDGYWHPSLAGLCRECGPMLRQTHRAFMKILITCFLVMAAFVTAYNATAAEVGDGVATKPAPPESYQIRNVKYGDLLRPQDANGADGTRIVLYPGQLWKCMTWKMYPAGESLYQLQNHFTGKTFIPKTAGAGTALVQVPFGPVANDRPNWRFRKLADGSYQIEDPKSGNALTATDSPDGTVRIVLAPWKELPEQKWELLKTDPATLTM